MLVLGRKAGESIVIDGVITITVLGMAKNGTVRLGIEAPKQHQVYRQELFLAIQAENRTATAGPEAAAALAAFFPTGSTPPPTQP
jgi:carbon storage regulator